MERIKRLFRPDRERRRKQECMANRKYEISPPLESLPGKQNQQIIHHTASVPTLNFTPQDQAHDASIAFIETHTSEDLNRLLSERDRGGSLVVRGPKTIGTSEVHRVLSEPSIRSVARLHEACKQAEFSLKYGTSGRIIYNFSKSLAWNKARAPRVPSLQLRSFGDMVKGSTTLIEGSNRSVSHTSIPINEVGGGKDTPNSSHGDTHEEPEPEPDYNPRDSILKMLDIDAPETEWEIQEAKALTVIQVPTSKVCTVQISYGHQSPGPN
ncbi:hypothetical protein F4821DRAFT_252834 [Hypoxylon rubiginosum]|uniref:Uncharacterized protein n=1 Tax=Hypoxylon rubiginosum TaxID=110542 RepID=A0ACC0DM24_9PEZI|nr:hypothetical protein F4821DRAFT_252834 [Hypoxylon rubiginosum]